MAQVHARAQMNARPRVLVIAGTDSSGGAGLLRDVQVISEFGVDASCAITAVTAQSHHRVASTCVLSADLVHEQIRAAFESGPVNAIKMGMLGNGAVVEVVAQLLPDRADVPIVLDPVLAASSGAQLLDEAGLLMLKQCLLSRCTLITPNLMEAAILLGESAAVTETAMSRQAHALLRFGPASVLLKGGHARGADAPDVLVVEDGSSTVLRAERLNVSLRGTGCALSSAIAASMALGMPLAAACQRAKDYVQAKLRTAAGL